MKAEFNIDTTEFEERIVQRAIKALKPLLSGKTEDNTLLTVKSLAEYLSVSDQWVYERVKLKEIPYIKIGKFPRFKRRDIDAWLESLKTPAVNSLSAPLRMLK